MNYIYNIYLNFNKLYFDFYDWKDTDNILHINKIPIIKISNNDFKNIISNQIKLSHDDYKKIKNKTEIFKNDNDSCLILTDSKNISAIKFDKNGISTMISSFNLDDEYEILELSKKLKENSINYNVINKRTYIFETRDEYIQRKYLLKNINTLKFDTLKYIYYECFNKEENNHNLMKSKLKQNIINNNDIVNKIYNILKPISTN